MSEINKTSPALLWTEEDLNLGEPLEYHWAIDLKVAAEDLWPYVADSHSFNRRLGMAPMFFKEEDGRMFGESQSLGWKLRWEGAAGHGSAGRRSPLPTSA